MRYKNPSNDYEEKINDAGLFCLLFGPLYFAGKGVWTHAVISLVLALVTFGISWLFYPFFARGIVEQNYLRKGWIPIEESDAPSPPKKSYTLPFLGLIVFIGVMWGIATNHNGTSSTQLTNITTSKPAVTWNYNTEKDTMTQKEIWTASVDSNNEIFLDPPYSGAQKAPLEIRRPPK